MRQITKWLTWLIAIVLLAIHFFVVPPTAVYACSCAPSGTPVEELERATAVFAGRVTQIGVITLGLGGAPLQGSEESLPWTSTIFSIFTGLILVAIGLFMPQINRKLGIPERSDSFATPRFQRSARKVEMISRIVVMLLGLGSLLRGIGGRLASHALFDLISWILLGLAFFGVATVIGITLVNWRAGEN